MNASAGIVDGRPQVWLRLEGAALFAAALGLFLTTGVAWWWFLVLLLAPDIGAVGYALGKQAGAFTYNLAHATVLPIALGVYGLANDSTWPMAIALIWFAHIGMDRAVGYGLKYDDHPGHTHLGMKGRGPLNPSDPD